MTMNTQQVLKGLDFVGRLENNKDTPLTKIRNEFLALEAPAARGVAIAEAMRSDDIRLRIIGTDLMTLAKDPKVGLTSRNEVRIIEGGFKKEYPAWIRRVEREVLPHYPDLYVKDIYDGGAQGFLEFIGVLEADVFGEPARIDEFVTETQRTLCPHLFKGDG